MITEPTVLVLGAGASVPYDYPAGERLKKKIEENLARPDSPVLDVIAESHIADRGKIRAFADSLRRSTVDSVDAFLEHNPQFLKIGKFSIAQALVPYEKEENLISAPNDGHWYKYLFSQMIDTRFDDFKNNKLTVVTFNYDRSFEHYLYMAFNALHSQEDEGACMEQIRAITVIHLHGRLGFLPWQTQAGGEVFPYGFVDKRQGSRESKQFSMAVNLGARAKDIKIIHEAAPTDEEFARAHDAICRAKRIYFIGFGYAQTNLNRLFPLAVLEYLGKKKSVDIRGSCMGFPAAEYPRVKRHFESKLGCCLRQLDDDAEARKRDALEFLKHDAPLV